MAIILVLFVLLGATYAIVTPVFEASDELWHYPMIRHLADGNPLPVQVFDPAQAGPWKQEASQPPLYYYLGAALTFWIDTGDIQRVRWVNPHANPGVITKDGNINLVVHDPQQFPWQGTLLAVRIVRLASVLMGAVTVALTYHIAREVVPQRPALALGAAAANAFTPMFLFISGAVNNDNLAIPLASLALLLMIRLIKTGPEQPTWSSKLKAWGILGIVIGLAVLTKEGTLGLLPLAWGTALVAAWQEGFLRREDALNPDITCTTPILKELGQMLLRSSVTFVIMLVPVLVIAGWWYYRNILLYGDWLGWNAFIAVLGQRPQPATLAQLWDEHWGFLAAFWGLFGGLNVPMSTWIYHVLNGVLVLAVLGFPFYFFRSIQTWWRATGKRRSWSLRALFDNVFLFVRDHFALIVCLLFSVAVVIGLIRWATTTWSSQGRLVFTAISALMLLLILGLAGWMPPIPAKITVIAFNGFLFLIALAAPFIWIRPAYQVPAQPVPADLTPVDVTFGDKLRLVGYYVATSDGQPLRPGTALDVTLVWEVLEAMQHDWSVFIHLNDPVLEAPVAQRDMYPGQGLLATRLLEPGQRIVNYYHISVPPTAVVPSELELVVGLYDYYKRRENIRLPASTGEDAVPLTQLPLEPVPGRYPNSTSVNFGDQLELLGFEIEPRRTSAGDTMQLVLYWQALQSLEKNYTLFAQVLSENDTTRWAHNDMGQETSTWSVSEAHRITMPLQLRDDTPSGVFRVIVGAYTMDEQGNFIRLQIVRNGRITMDDVLFLTQIRVD